MHYPFLLWSALAGLIISALIDIVLAYSLRSRRASVYYIVDLKEVRMGMMFKCRKIIAAHSDREAKKQFQEQNTGVNSLPHLCLLLGSDLRLVHMVLQLTQGTTRPWSYFVKARFAGTDTWTTDASSHACSREQALYRFIGSPQYWDYRFEPWILVEISPEGVLREVATGTHPPSLISLIEGEVATYITIPKPQTAAAKPVLP